MNSDIFLLKFIISEEISSENEIKFKSIIRNLKDS